MKISDAIKSSGTPEEKTKAKAIIYEKGYKRCPTCWMKHYNPDFHEEVCPDCGQKLKYINFDIETFEKGQIAVNVKNATQAVNFLNYLAQHKIPWRGKYGVDSEEETKFDEYADFTIYLFDKHNLDGRLIYGSLVHLQRRYLRDVKLIKYDDLFKK